MAKKNSNTLTATVTAKIDSVKIIHGDILSITDTAVTIRYQKPHSSKFLAKVVPFNSNLIAYVGSEGTKGSVFLADKAASILSQSGVTEMVGGFTRVTGEDKNGLLRVVNFNSQYADATVSEVDAPSDDLRAKKRSKVKAEGAAPKSKKKALKIRDAA